MLNGSFIVRYIRIRSLVPEPLPSALGDSDVAHDHPHMTGFGTAAIESGSLANPRVDAAVRNQSSYFSRKENPTARKDRVRIFVRCSNSIFEHRYASEPIREHSRGRIQEALSAGR